MLFAWHHSPLAEYPLEHFQEDVVLTSVTFSVGVCAVMAGQIAGYDSMPEDKRNYTWETFWPVTFDRCISFFDHFEGYEYTKKLAECA